MELEIQELDEQKIDLEVKTVEIEAKIANLKEKKQSSSHYLQLFDTLPSDLETETLQNLITAQHACLTET